MRRGGIRVSDFLADSRKTRERRTFRYGHLLGPGLREQEIHAWQRQWARHVLPSDLAALLLELDGIHLWADLDTGHSYTGMAPLAEWNLARVTMYGPESSRDLLSDQYLALSYHADGAAFVVLDADTGAYYSMDSCGPDTSARIGTKAEDLLDYFWSHRIE